MSLSRYTQSTLNVARHAKKSKVEGKIETQIEYQESQEPLAAAQPPAAAVSKPEVLVRNGDELPSAPTAQPSVKTETPVAAKDSSARVADANVPSTPTTPASVTKETLGAKDLDKYKWEAAIIVMIAWLLIVAFGKILIRRRA